MLTVAVLHAEKSNFSELILRSFQNANYSVVFASRKFAYEQVNEGKQSVFILSADNMQYFIKCKPDIFTAEPTSQNLLYGGKIACRSAVLYGEDACYFAESVISERVITYGMSPKDTVTVSSAVDKMTLALQREIITLSGETVEMQEIGIPVETNSDPNRLMASVCIQILSGTKPTEISGIVKDFFR